MSFELQERWQEVLAILSSEIAQISFEQWLKDMKPVQYEEEDDVLLVSVPNKQTLPLIEAAYTSVVKNAVEKVFNIRPKIKFVEEKSSASSKANVEKKATDYNSGYKANKNTLEDIAEDKSDRRTAFQNDTKNHVENKPLQKKERPFSTVSTVTPYFNEEYIVDIRWNFDNFVIGPNNQFAHATALSVAKNPGREYNPLFIYGGPGLGKTHLLHAIACYIMQHSNKKILFVSAEMFTNEYISSLKTDTKAEFDSKYRLTDVLIIDDIQFLIGKTETQETFFHVFNALYNSNKQIVISSDRSPNELNELQERLKQRFAQNIIADITPPSFETRLAILENFADNYNIELTDEVKKSLEFIAERIRYNIRELEGAFTRLLAFSKFYDQEITLSLAESCLKNLGSDEYVISIQNIINAVCNYFEITPEEMKSKTRKRKIAHPRHIAMYLCRNLTEESFANIGKEFGNMDHTSIIHGCDKIEAECLNNSETRKIVAEIKEGFKS